MAPQVIEKQCENCNHDRTTITTKLVKLPKVMLLYLKRYKYLTEVGGKGGKVTRLVDIPDIISLDGMVREDVKIPDSNLPEVISLSGSKACSSEQTQIQPASTFGKQVDFFALPYEDLGTPKKFLGKTEEEISRMSEEDRLEYTLMISQKEALTSSGRVVPYVDEDKDYKAAREASLLDMKTSPSRDYDQVELKRRGDSETELKPSTRKRQPSDVPETPAPPIKMNRCAEPRRGDTPTPTLGLTLPDKPLSENSLSSEKKHHWKKSYHPPQTKAEEEADLLKALENSILQDEGGGRDLPESTDAGAASEDVSGPPEFSYKLSSIVSHFGLTTTSGHYVADVQRLVFVC